MKNQFIETANTKRFNEICHELADPASLIGPSLAMATGPAGRGKTEAARHHAVNSDAVYIPPLNIRTPTMLLREMAFELGRIRPFRSEACLSVISEEMAKNRRLIIIDEADLLSFEILEMLRNLNERFACPVMLLGEEDLIGRVAARRRISSRMRRRMEFSPISQHDIAFFFTKALELKPSPEVAAFIQRRSNGDWRPVLTIAAALERAMRASNLNNLTLELVKNVAKAN